MPIELEAKMKLDDPAPVAARLRELGAEFVGDFFEINTFLDTESRELLAGHRGVRLRVSKNLQTGAAACILTHKGPNGHSSLKKRQETEVVVANADDARAFLECLKLVPMFSFQKKRQSWKLAGCNVELDEVPHLGHFIEIEGPGEPEIMRLRELLGLSHRALIKSSYAAMLSSHLQERGDRRTEVVFE